MKKKKKTSNAFKRKQRKQREEMKQKLHKINTFLGTSNLNTVFTETKYVNSSNNSRVSTTVSNKKSTFVAKESSISTHTKFF